MNLVLIIFLLLIDAYFYGYCYEYRIKKENHPIGIFNNIISASLFNLFEPFFIWLFKDHPWKGESWVPRYRLLVQWPLDILVIVYLYFNGKAVYIFGIYAGTYELLGFLVAVYCMVKEFGYYAVLNQVDLIINEYTREAKNNPRKNVFCYGYTYWLERVYFSGAWLFMPYYTFNKFYFSFLTGLGLVILSNFIW